MPHRNLDRLKIAWRWIGHASVAHWLFITVGGLSLLAWILNVALAVNWRWYWLAFSILVIGVGLVPMQRQRKKKHNSTDVEATNAKPMAAPSGPPPSPAAVASARPAVGRPSRTEDTSTSLPERLQKLYNEGVQLKGRAKFGALGSGLVTPATSGDVAQWEDRVAYQLRNKADLRARFETEPPGVDPIFAHTMLLVGGTPLMRQMEHRLKMLAGIIERLQY